jgi:8-oxo-dGTP pyrophosphatase MutT (NUDIX family)
MFATIAAAPATPRASAAVFLVRPRGTGPGLEVLLLRRHRGASFMSSSFVFPGGVAESGEDDPRLTAARELFEEAGVLLCDRPVDAGQLEALRRAQADGAPLATLLERAGLVLALERLRPFARWITPSAEPRRYDARFFVAELPPGQVPSFDARETVDQVWVAPAEALARRAELRLPPPQVRSFADLAAACDAGWTALAAEAARRAVHPEPILPRLERSADGFALLLPWDPSYAVDADGHELAPWPDDHPLATGPSRFVLDDGGWRNVGP